MRRSAKFGLVLMAGSLLVNTLTLTVAMAAAGDYYLLGDGVPVASMSAVAPPAISLPDYDPWRDPGPGTLLKKGGSGAGETDPTKFQQWQIDVSGTSLSANTLTIWVMGVGGADVEFTAHLLRCAANCVSLANATKTVSQPTTWKKTTVTLTTPSYTYSAGERLVVKIVVTSASEGDMLLAYGTQTYAAFLKLNGVTPPTTTTTLPSSTTTSAATTTVPSSTTTTPGPTTTSVGPTTTSSGGASATTTVGTGSTTTVAGASTTRAESVSGSTTTLASSPDATPIAAGDPGAEMVVEASEAGIADDVFGADRRLSPQEGLSVSFLSAAEAFRSQFLASTGLGLLGALLVVFGMRRKDDDAEEEQN